MRPPPSLGLEFLFDLMNHWRLSAIVPVVIGAIAATSWALTRPSPMIESVARIAITPREAEVLRSFQVLGPVIASSKSNIAKPAGLSSYEQLARSIEISRQTGTDIYDVSVRQSEPGKAQPLLEKILAELKSQRLPRDQEQETIQFQIAVREASVEQLEELKRMMVASIRLLAEYKAAVPSAEITIQELKSVRELMSFVTEVEARKLIILDLKNQLAGDGPDLVINPPSEELPSIERGRMSPVRIGIIAAVLSLVSIVLFICLRVLIRYARTQFNDTQNVSGPA